MGVASKRCQDDISNPRNPVAHGFQRGAPIEAVQRGLDISRYADLRHFPRFHATFRDNAATIYAQLSRTKEAK